MSKRAGLVAVAVAMALAGCATGEGVAESEVLEDGWQSLVAGEWTVDPGARTEICVRRTLEEDLHVGAIETTVDSVDAVLELRLTVSEPSNADGVGVCNDKDGEGSLIYAGGPTSLPFELPDTVAAYLPAGSQVVLALQLANPLDTSLAGAVDVQVHALPEREVTGVADALVVEAGELRLDRDSFLFGVSLGGSPEQVVAHSSFSGDISLMQASEGASAVEPHLLDWPVPMRAGEAVEVVCGDDTVERATASTPAADCKAVIYRFSPLGDGA